MTDLDKLIAAVEASDAEFLASDDWIEAWDAVAPSLQTYRMKSDGESAAIISYAAYNGSLDAALRLHEALLPGWELTHMGQHEAGWMVAVARLGPPTRHEGGHPTTPARAWLLAILRVLKAKGDA